VLSVLLQKAETEMQQQVRAKAIISKANSLSKLFYDAGVAMGGYSITKSPLFDDRYKKICAQIPVDVTELKALVGDDKGHQSDLLVKIQEVTSSGIVILDQSKAAIDDNRVDVAQFRARHMYKNIRMLADQLQQQLKELTENERKLETLSPEQLNASRTLVKFALIFGVILNAGLAFAQLYYNHRASALGVL